MRYNHDGMEDLPSIVPGLAALAGPEAVEGLERGEAFVVTIDDIPIRVTYTSGTTPTVFLSTPYAPRETPAGAMGYRDANVGRVKAPPPMFIELIPETEDERRAKREGVSREVQTGDAEFDRAVYVAAVRRVVALGRPRPRSRLDRGHRSPNERHRRGACRSR
jgi:hypothetical protein